MQNIEYKQKNTGLLRATSIRLILILSFSLFGGSLYASENTDSISDSSKWNLNAQLYSVIPSSGNTTLMPVLTASKGHLYLQSRYNYESFHTFSASVGYILEGGDKLSYQITPIIGGMIGHTTGLLPEISFNINYRNFSLSSDSEYLINVEYPRLNYISTWNEFTYNLDWFYAGIAVQRSRIVNTYLDIQRGVVAGASVHKITFMGYLFNFLNSQHDMYGMLAVDVEF